MLTRKIIPLAIDACWGVKNTTSKAEVILTADRTLMSNYHCNEFISFGATASPNVVPVKCLARDIRWTKVIMKSYFGGKWYSKMSSFFYYWLFVKKLKEKRKMSTHLCFSQGLKV